MDNTTTNSGSDATQSPSSNSNNAIFAKFDSYPWGRDRPFLQGLVAMLGPLTPGYDRQTALGISLQARIWWYKSRLDIQIDRTAYENHIQQQPAKDSSSPCPDPSLLTQIQEIQERMAAVAAKPDLPAWQLQAPKVDPNKKAEDGVSNHQSSSAAGEDAPYPAHFQAIIEAVTMGKPVPGVREIPNTVVRQPGITPVGKMQAPKKPWERSNQEQRQEGGVTTTELEFPPVEEDVATTTTA
ncbi:hypothetical protein V8F33_013174 [Rhypophila sp. PSN 637]